MGGDDARAFINGLKVEKIGQESLFTHWKNQKHIATDCFRSGVIKKLSREQEDFVVLVEIYLNKTLPKINDFEGIFEVDNIGIWYYDGDGHVDDHVWRQHVIQWRYIDNIVLHQVS